MDVRKDSSRTCPTPGEHREGDVLCLTADRAESVLMAAASLVFVVAGLTIAVVAEATGTSRWLLAVPCYLGVPFFGCCLVSAVRRLSGSPVFIIDRQGLVDRTSVLAPGRVAWSEIDRVVVHRVGGSSYLGVVLRDAARVAERATILVRLTISLNRRLGFPAINISELSIPGTIEELHGRVAASLAAAASLRPFSASGGPR